MWKTFSVDPWVLETVQGYHIKFDSIPFQSQFPKEIQFQEEERKIVDIEIAELVRKGAIVESSSERGQYISNIFVVPKPNGKFRPIINLKQFNKFVHYEHFKQEHFRIVLQLVQKGDFFTSVDLQDAYFSIPIAEDSRKYLKFLWNDILYHYVCLPFGLSSAPRVFTKIL